MGVNVDQIVNAVRRWCTKTGSSVQRDMTRIILPLTILYSLGLSALLRANVDYKDDVGRIARGYRHWSSASRYLSDMLSVLIHNMSGGLITDTSPFPQILALFFMAAAGCWVIRVLAQNEEKGFCGKILLYGATVCMALNPYFLSCLSFKFDAPFMALSVLFSVLPLLYAKRDLRVFALISVLSVLAMCLTYQQSSGIFPLMVIAVAFAQWNKAEWSLKKAVCFLLVGAASFGLAMLIYKGVFVHAVPGYVTEEIWPLRELIPGTLQNYRTFYHQVRQDFTRGWKICVCLTAGCYYLHTIFASKRHKAAAAVFSALAMLAQSMMVFGVLMFMKDIGFYSRWMYGFCFWIGMMAVTLAGAERSYAGKLSAAALGWVFFIFALTYGNDLAVVKTYESERAQMIVGSMNELQLINDGNTYRICMTGGEAWPKSVKNHMEIFPVMERLIPFNGAYMWNREYILEYFGIGNMIYDEAVNEMALPILQSTSFYNIRGEGDYLLIEYKEN